MISKIQPKCLNKVNFTSKNESIKGFSHLGAPESFENKGAEILAGQNAAFIKVENKNTFNTQELEDLGIMDVFEPDEMIPQGERINLNSIVDLTTSSFGEQVRHFRHTGKIIPYMLEYYKEEARLNKLEGKEAEDFVQQMCENFINSIEEKKKEAILNIDKNYPTKAPHNVYRVIRMGHSEESNQYFNKITNLNKGENIVLSELPIYVSTSGKKVMQNYGAGGGKDCVLFKIELPVGTKILKFPSTDGIEQCIMKPDSKFEVVDNKKYDNNFHYLTLKHIL